MAKAIKILIIIAVVVGLLIIYFAGGNCNVCHSKSHIIHKFWEQLEIPKLNEIKYDFLIDKYGEPDKIFSTMIRGNNGVYYKSNIEYKSLVFLFSGDDKDDPTTWKCYGVTVKDKYIKFNNNIHVGVSKLWVEWTFRHQMKTKEDPNEYWTGHINPVKFTYDEFYRVSSITFYW